MLPIAIFRHSRTEGPGYFAIFLEQHGIPWRLIAVDEGMEIPVDPQEYAGLCFMGGPMSVNDPLPWIDQATELIRRAVECDIPVIGHCLGGQLMSKAMGGTVTSNPVKEIGWGSAQAEANEMARNWLGDYQHTPVTVFQWHGETFSIPPGAERILGNAYCTNQMFVLGPHLGMQCHVEMIPEMVANWCQSWGEEVTGLTELPASIQNTTEIQAQASQQLAAMRLLADQLYSVWIRGLQR